MLHNSKHGSLSRRMISNTLKQLQNMSAHVFPMRFSRSCFCLCLHFIQAIPHPEMDRPPGSRNTSGGGAACVTFSVFGNHKTKSRVRKRFNNAYVDASLAAIDLTGKHSWTLVTLSMKVLKGIFQRLRPDYINISIHDEGKLI